MAEINNTCIGRLTEVQESRMTAMLEHGDGFPRLDIEGRHVEVGQIGSYLVIRQGLIQVVAMVVRATEEERALRVGYVWEDEGLISLFTVRENIILPLLFHFDLIFDVFHHDLRVLVHTYQYPVKYLHFFVEVFQTHV